MTQRVGVRSAVTVRATTFAAMRMAESASTAPTKHSLNYFDLEPLVFAPFKSDIARR